MKRGCVVALGVAGGLTGVVGAIVVVAALSVRGVAPRTELSAAEKSLLVQVDDLVPYGVTPRAGRYTETCRAKRNVDRSLELEYAYGTAEGGAPFSLKSEAEISPDERAASESFAARVSAYKLGFRVAGGKDSSLQGQPIPPGLGEESYLGLVSTKGRATGSVLVTRQGCTVFSVLLSGVFIDDAEDWIALLAPHIGRTGCVSVGEPR